MVPTPGAYHRSEHIVVLLQPLAHIQRRLFCVPLFIPESCSRKS